MYALNDRELIEKLLTEDSKVVNETLEIIYRNNFKQIRKFVLKNRGTNEDAKDIFQEGVMIFYFNLLSQKFREESAISTYIFSICRNLWFQRLRKGLSYTELIEDTNIQAEEVSEVNSLMLSELINELKDECTQLLTGFYFYRKSMKKLMTEFALGSEQAVKNKKYRCMEFLIRKIKEKGLKIESFYI